MNKRVSSSAGEMTMAAVKLIATLRQLCSPEKLHYSHEYIISLHGHTIREYAQRMHQKIWKYSEQD